MSANKIYYFEDGEIKYLEVKEEKRMEDTKICTVKINNEIELIEVDEGTWVSWDQTFVGESSLEKLQYRIRIQRLIDNISKVSDISHNTDISFNDYIKLIKEELININENIDI